MNKSKPKVSRRNFVRIGAAFAGLTALHAPFVFAADNTKKYGGYRMGLQSYSYRKFPVEKAVHKMQHDLKINYVEMYSAHFPLDSSDQKIEEIKSLLASHSIVCNAHGVNSFSADHDANRKLFEFAQKAGVRNISANPSYDAFDSLDKLCAEFPNIFIAIHNHGPGAKYDKIADVVKHTKGRHPHIGACIDTGHYIRSAEDPVKAVYELKDRVFGLHVKDFAEQKGDAKETIIGQGHLDVKALFSAMKKTNFPADGVVSIEYEESAENPTEDIQKCLAVVEASTA